MDGSYRSPRTELTLSELARSCDHTVTVERYTRAGGADVHRPHSTSRVQHAYRTRPEHLTLGFWAELAISVLVLLALLVVVPALVLAVAP